MKNLNILMMVLGFALVSACASNEKTDAAESDASAKAEAMKEEQSAAAAKEAEEARADLAAQADEEVEVVEVVEVDVEAPAMDESGSATSGDLVSTCTYGDQVRVIRVVYDNPETGNVCEVTYEKSSGVQTLWSAVNERDYCQDKATAFVEKQQGWGWTCSNLE